MNTKKSTTGLQNSNARVRIGHARPAVAGYRSFLMAAAVGMATISSVRADYQSTVLSDGPVAYYPLNLDVGAGVVDLSGNSNDGIASAIDTAAAGPSAFIPNAIRFDGAFSYIDLGGGGNPGLLNFGGPITLEAWVQPATSSQGLMNILAKGYDASSDNNEITLRANGGNYYAGTYSNTNNVQGVSGGQQTTSWTHLVATHDGGTWRLYVNGALVQSSSDAVGAMNWTAPWRIGTGSVNGSERFFQGDICQVALYTSALSLPQVLNHFFVGWVGVEAANATPLITAQPLAQSTFAGGTATFSFSAVSALSATNQWYKNNTPIPGQTNSSLTLNNVQSGDVADYSVRIGNSNGTTNSTPAGLVLLTPGASLQWSPVANSGVWDTGITANWINLANSTQVPFNTSDQVRFDDAVGAPTSVSVDAAVSPSLITVDSAANEYTLSGLGQITGAGSLVKKGGSTLTLNVTGGFTGSATIAGGTVKTVGRGTLASASTIIVTNGGTLDFSGNAMPANKTVTVSGAGVNAAGALYNSGGEVYDNVLNVKLAGDTTFGGTARWDISSGSSISGPHKLTLVRSSSAAYGEWVGVNIANDVGDIELVTGKLGVKNMGSSFGNPASKLIVDDGFELDFWSGGCNRQIHVRNNGLVQILTALSAFDSDVTLDEGARWSAFWGSGDLPMNGTFTLNGIAHIVLGDANFIFNDVISGPGGFVWDAYNHQMVFAASNTYSGPTVIGSGLTVTLSGNGSISHSSLIFFGGSDSNSVHLDVSGRPDQTLTLASGQTLAGIGAVGGKLVVSPGAILAPAGSNTVIGITTGANPTGTIVANGDITLRGTTVIKLNAGTNDAVQTVGGISYGGTLNLVNIAGTPLVAGDSFQIFNAGNYTDSFSSITPATPSAGLAWDTTQLNIGKISVVSSVGPMVASVTTTGGNLIFSGGGGVAHLEYVVLTSTDLAAPLSNWIPLVTNRFDANGAFGVTNAISSAVPQRFYILYVP